MHAPTGRPAAAARDPDGAGSDSQALAALGAASGDDGTATAGLHADQETVGARATDLRGLIGAFHFDCPWENGKTRDYRKKPSTGKALQAIRVVFPQERTNGRPAPDNFVDNTLRS
jgi:hypothetical protein